jgi:hypothetical protein
MDMVLALRTATFLVEGHGMNAVVANGEGRIGAHLSEVAPAEAFVTPDRIVPLRKPAGFVPQVQRWSFQLPDGEPGLHVAFFGA